jgi:Putative peptidoglycan binding domain
MKKFITPYLIITITAGLALAHPFSASAADDNPNDVKQHGKAGNAHAAKGSAQAAQPAAASAHVSNKPVAQTATIPKQQHAAQVQQSTAQQNINNTTRNGNTNTANASANAAYAKHGNTNKSAGAASAQQQVARQQTVQQQAVQQQAAKQYNSRSSHATNATYNQTQVAVVSHGSNGGGQYSQYTRENNYGGRWTSGNNHPDWNQNNVTVWNNHHYRWYNGGWLIVDGGFWPVPGGYQGGSSMMAGAQQQLSNDGYYNGPIDGVAGPGTREAIAHYQTDYNLPVSGHLNPPTRESLGLD